MALVLHRHCSELYCYNTEGDRKSIKSHGSCRMDVTRLEHETSKLTHGEAGGIDALHIVLDDLGGGVTLKVYE